MKILMIIGFSILASCSNNNGQSSTAFKRLLPDTSRSWSGQMTKKNYYLTRELEKKFHLRSLYEGSQNLELRIWDLHGYYDPQQVIILSKENSNIWNLRIISFYNSANDSVVTDNIKKINSPSVDSLNLAKYWSLESQSDMKLGDSYGCNDGYSYFIELADSSRYRFMWYRCPNMHENKDSAFLKINELAKKVYALAFKN